MKYFLIGITNITLIMVYRLRKKNTVFIQTGYEFLSSGGKRRPNCYCFKDKKRAIRVWKISISNMLARSSRSILNPMLKYSKL